MPRSVAWLPLRPLVFLLLVALYVRPTVGVDEYLEIDTGRGTLEERLPLIIALHGYGQSPERIVRVLDGLPLRARVIAPHGLFRTWFGWGWFPRRVRTSADELLPGITRAADAVLRIIAQAEQRPICGKPIVLGFSQGGYLAYALASRAPEQIFAAFPIGGFLPGALHPKTHRGAMPRVIAFHGEADTVIDADSDRWTHGRFVAAGYPGTLHRYPGIGHEINAELRRELLAAVEQAIRDEGCAR